VEPGQSLGVHLKGRCQEEGAFTILDQRQATVDQACKQVAIGHVRLVICPVPLGTMCCALYVHQLLGMCTQQPISS
jgi:hypothetical protein